MTDTKTHRGLELTEFKDDYLRNCSLQESSCATDHKIWLGINEARMYLTRGQVSDLLPYLQRFVETGEIHQ